MLVNFNVPKVQVLRYPNEPDQVFFFTNLPSSTPKTTDEGLHLIFDVEKDTAEEYLKLNFGITTKNTEIEIINI